MAKGKNRYIYLHLFVMVYLIAAFSWWAILLYNKNEDNYVLQQRLANTGQSVDSRITDKYLTQRKMILSEGLFFGLSILGGLILIYRAFRKELRLNQALSDFLLSVTHELKTPIASIKLVHQTMGRDNISADNKQKLLRTGKEEAERLESLVNNILTAAQIDNAYKFNFESLDLSALLQTRLSRFKKLFTDREFIIKVPDNLTAKIDKEAFSKVIDNLLHNAIKYSPSNSSVSVLLESDATHHTIKVIDEGAGISNKERKHVWKKFYRIGNENTRETTGTGLGLWIVNEIVKAHKGSIMLTDNQPQGCIFNITLPRV